MSALLSKQSQNHWGCHSSVAKWTDSAGHGTLAQAGAQYQEVFHLNTRTCQNAFMNKHKSQLFTCISLTGNFYILL